MLRSRHDDRSKQRVVREPSVFENKIESPEPTLHHPHMIDLQSNDNLFFNHSIKNSQYLDFEMREASEPGLVRSLHPYFASSS